MKTYLTKDLMKFMLTAAVAVALMPVADLALAAGSNLSTTASEVKTQIGVVPNFVAGICYIAGVIMVVAGLLKLKAHAENPGQTPMAQGLSRLVFGATLLAFPSFTGWILSTVSTNGGTAVNASGLGALN